MKNADKPAFPADAIQPTTSFDPREPSRVVTYPGMTKREHFALELYAALVVAEPTHRGESYRKRDKRELASLATEYADVLLSRLDLESA